MITNYLAAVAGSGDIGADLVSDSLKDTLWPAGHEARLLVPAVENRLPQAVRTVVECAWANNVQVIAVADRASSGEVVDELLEGADVVVQGVDINELIADALARGLPDASLVVIDAQDMDQETNELVRLCHKAGVPVLDLSNALRELEPFDLDESDATPKEAGEVVEAPQFNSNSSEDSAVAVPASGDLPPAAAKRLAAVQQGLTKLLGSVQQMSAEIAGITGEDPPTPRPVRPPPPPKFLVSFDDGKTWEPRGRGRLPKDALVKRA